MEFTDLETYQFIMQLYEANEFCFDRLEPWLREHAVAVDS